FLLQDVSTIYVCIVYPILIPSVSLFFFLFASSTILIYTLSLHDALPIFYCIDNFIIIKKHNNLFCTHFKCNILKYFVSSLFLILDRKSTRLNSSHVSISYAVFCSKKKTRT